MSQWTVSMRTGSKQLKQITKGSTLNPNLDTAKLSRALELDMFQKGH